MKPCWQFESYHRKGNRPRTPPFLQKLHVYTRDLHLLAMSATTLQVAAVVAFYMSSALVVCPALHLLTDTTDTFASR